MTNNECHAIAIGFYNTKLNIYYYPIEHEQWNLDREEIKQLCARFNADFDEAKFNETCENGESI